VRRALAALIVCAGLAGCGGAGSETSSEQPSRHSAPRSASEFLSRPVAYAVDRSDLASLADLDLVGAMTDAPVVASSQWKGTYCWS
jgi:hypothetical protein